jgi:hypothetical protein
MTLLAESESPKTLRLVKGEPADAAWQVRARHTAVLVSNFLMIISSTMGLVLEKDAGTPFDAFATGLLP